MLKGFKYRLYPTPEQEILLAKHFGSVRLLYNLALDAKTYAYRSQGISIGYHELATTQLKELKADFPFLKEVNAQSLQQSLKHLDTAYQNFFKHKNDFPIYKSKYRRQSFAVPQNFFIEHGRLNIPKFREGIKIELHRPTKGILKSVTISRTPTGKYFASMLCDTKEEIIKRPITENKAVGIDLGLKSFVYCSDGQHWDMPKYLRKSESLIKHLSRSMNRKVKGSKRRNKARLKLARQHEKVANQRKDFLHKVSSAITKQYDTLCFESLNVTGMLKNHCLAKSISDAGWGAFVTMCKYKAESNGGSVLSIGTFEPSTIECNECGAINHDLTLSDRDWTCSNCNTYHSRDENAAKVIKRKCLSGVERTLEDAEVLPLSLRKRKGKQAVEASKVLDMSDSSLIFSDAHVI